MSRLASAILIVALACGCSPHKVTHNPAPPVTAPGSYSESVDVGDVTTYNVDQLTGGLNYYFTVTAYNNSGVESDYSIEISEYVESIDTTPPVMNIYFVFDLFVIEYTQIFVKYHDMSSR